MSLKRGHRRFVVILQEEDSGYETDASKKPAGYAKIQVKGAKGVLTIYVQNLKYSLQGEWVYKGFLAHIGEKCQVVNTGTIVIDDKGRGERVWEFDTGNVQNTGNDIYSFDVVGVIVEHRGSENKGFVCPLSGYIGREQKNWRRSLAMEESAEGGILREKTHIEPEDGKQQKIRAGTAREAYGEHYEQAMAGLDRRIEEYMDGALQFYQKAEPFDRLLNGCKWWYINTYNYLFGIKYDKTHIKYYIYGIPGAFDSVTEKQMNSCGFFLWRAAKNVDNKAATYGYWLAFIDAATGMAVRI